MCGGQMRLIAFVTESTQIRKILDHIGVDSEPPHIAPARAPPLWDDGGEALAGKGDFAWLRGSLRARQIQSRLFARGLAFQLPRRLKLHKSKMLGNPKPVPYLSSCG